MNQSQRMATFNKARTAARRGVTTKQGQPIKPVTVNRALGVLQRSDQSWRTKYETHWDGTQWICKCPSRERPCKHIVAKMLEDRPAPKPDNILQLALAQAKPQWSSGESVWLWRNGNEGYFLKEGQGVVRLCASGKTPSCIIFYLDVTGWEVSEVVNAKFAEWLKKVG